jgi:hypothetical protein
MRNVERVDDVTISTPARGWVASVSASAVKLRREREIAAGSGMSAPATRPAAALAARPSAARGRPVRPNTAAACGIGGWLSLCNALPGRCRVPVTMTMMRSRGHGAQRGKAR